MKDAYGCLNMDLDCTSINRDWLQSAYSQWYDEIHCNVPGIFFARNLLRYEYFYAISMTAAYKPVDSWHSYEAQLFQHLHSIRALIELPI